MWTCTSGGDLPSNQCHRFVCQCAEGYLGQRMDHTANPRQLEQFVEETLHGGCSHVDIGNILSACAQHCP